MEQGSVRRADDLYLKNPAPGDASAAVFVTWSRPKSSGGFWLKPGDRKEFAKILGEAVDIINTNVPPANIAITCAVFKEFHKGGDAHHHAILESKEKSTCWYMMSDILRQNFRVPCHVQIGTGRGFNHIERMLRYVMVPTVAKWDLDPTPFFSPGFAVPEKIVAARSKAFVALKSRPSTNDEVFGWLQSHPGVDTYNNFVDFVDENVSPGDIALSRLAKFISKNVKDGRQIVDFLIQRRDRKQKKKENCLGWNDLMDIAWKAECACSPPNTLKRQLIWSVEWHDKNERQFKESKRLLGAFAANLYFGTFQDRKENIFGVGTKGSGKSTVLHVFENLVPPHRVFAPAYDSSAPFSGLGDHHILGSFQEFRCRQNVDSATTLLWLEGKENLKVDVKHEAPLVLPRGGPRCILSSNYLIQCAGWKDADIEALYDRCEVFYWNMALPEGARTQAARNKCQKCSIAFLAACSPKLLSHFERTLGPHGVKTSTKIVAPKES